jgi:hypothetical protein
MRSTITEFDTSLTAVQPSFAATAIQQLWDAAANPPRGEYETTADWELRVAAAQSRVAGRFFAVWYSPSGFGRDSIWAYDADRQLVGLHLSLLFPPALMWTEELAMVISVPFLPVECRRLGLRVTGTRCIGVVLPGDVIADYSAGLDHRPRGRREPLWVDFALSPDSARLLKPYLKFLLVFRVRDTPGALRAAGTTVAGPYALFGAVLVDRLEVWAIDRRSGRRIARVPVPVP